MPDTTVIQTGAAALSGLLFGSFLNVCIHRIPRDLSVVKPRSFCPECRSQIGWIDNIPLLSYVALKGRCRACTAKIPLRYPLVELTTAIFYAVVVARYGWTAAALKWALFETAMVALFWTDMEERILPDEFTIGGSVAGLVFAFFVPVHGAILDVVLSPIHATAKSLLAAAAGGILLAAPMWGIGALYSVVRKREGLGFGDVKLLFLMGSFLGVESGIFALMIGTVTGSVLGLAYVSITRQSASTYPLPFGSFLSLGAALVPLITMV